MNSILIISRVKKFFSNFLFSSYPWPNGRRCVFRCLRHLRWLLEILKVLRVIYFRLSRLNEGLCSRPHLWHPKARGRLLEWPPRILCWCFRRNSGAGFLGCDPCPERLLAENKKNDRIKLGGLISRDKNNKLWAFFEGIFGLFRLFFRDFFELKYLKTFSRSKAYQITILKKSTKRKLVIKKSCWLQNIKIKITNLVFLTLQSIQFKKNL